MKIEYLNNFKEFKLFPYRCASHYKRLHLIKPISLKKAKVKKKTKEKRSSKAFCKPVIRNRS